MAGVGVPAPRNAELGVNRALVRGDFRAPISAHQQRQWLRSSREWTDLKRTWRATKILGAGSYGICGLWRYVGEAGNWTGPNHVVVKQMAQQNYEFQVESTLMERIMKYTGGTDHVVKLYKACYTSPGSGTSDVDPNPFDPITGAYDGALDVARIYLEYCPGGDLHEAAINFPWPALRWPEEILWRLLHCFAKALLVLETGAEDPHVAPWARPIAHFDIKPHNTFIGARDQGPGEHQRFYPFKVADFGLALPVPDDITQPIWTQQTEWRGTVGFHAPEQIYTTHPEPNISIPTDIWNLGNLMHMLIHYQGRTNYGIQQPVKVPQNNGPPIWQFNSKTFWTTTPTIPSTNREAFQTFGHDILELSDAGFYSKHIIELTHACLAYLPSKRPTAAQVLHHAEAAVQLYAQMNVALPAPVGPLEFGQGGINNPLPPGLRRFRGVEIAAFLPPVDLPVGILRSVPVGDWLITPDPPGAPGAGLLFPVAGIQNVRRGRLPRTRAPIQRYGFP